MYPYKLSSDITENCPTADLEGYFEPTENQNRLLFKQNSFGKYNSYLVGDFVPWGNPIGILAMSVICRLIRNGRIRILAIEGVVGSIEFINALSDIVVSGNRNFGIFREIFENENISRRELLNSMVESEIPTQLSRIGITADLSAITFELRNEVIESVDRAILVAWAIYGPSAIRNEIRPPLGWITVISERDSPSRPINVVGTSAPTSDLDVEVMHNGQLIRCRTRFSIYGSEEVNQVFSLSSLPETTKLPLLPKDKKILLFLHGHSSRLEEGHTLYYDGLMDDKIFESSLLSSKPLMVSFDFPSNGYAEYIDHEELSPFSITTSYNPDEAHSSERRFGMLEFYEKFTIEFVEQLHTVYQLEEPNEDIKKKILAIIGGSMGGNLTLRLTEKLVTNVDWLKQLVSWSPASSYKSFGRYDYFIPSPGEQSDPIGKEALERPHDRLKQNENDDSRANYFRLIFEGERLINDGTTGFEIGTRFLAFMGFPLFFGLPILGNLFQSGFLSPAVFASGFEKIANINAFKQSDEWLRERCRLDYDQEIANRAAMFDISETYSTMRRRMHWRIAYEQLLFSHFDIIEASGTQTCLEASEIPVLLIGGSDDQTNSRFNIYQGVENMANLMVNNDGRARLLEETGHSIHAERPKWLARSIYLFTNDQEPKEVSGVLKNNGRITDLFLDTCWKTKPLDSFTGDFLLEGRISTGYYIKSNSNTSVNKIYVTRVLKTSSDSSKSNNLRSLPITSYPLGALRAWQSPLEGFDITHIYLPEGSDFPENPLNNYNWILYLVNDSKKLKINISYAELNVRRGNARYYINTPSGEKDLVLLEYFTTNPDDDIENNLSNLPEIN